MPTVAAGLSQTKDACRKQHKSAPPLTNPSPINELAIFRFKKLKNVWDVQCACKKYEINFLFPTLPR